MVTTVKLVPTLPTQDELPYDDGVPMESPRHKLQLEILTETLTPWLEQREDGFMGGDMFVYFSANEVKTEDFKGPDFFAVLGVPKGERKSWVVWQEEEALVIQERQKNEKLVAYLRSLGINPDEI